MRVTATGYGAGDHEFADTPNVLRVLVGEADASRAIRAHGDRVLVVESEIDDMNPQLFGSVMDQLYAAGALEVFFVPVQMKKSRPGHAGVGPRRRRRARTRSSTCCSGRRRPSACGSPSGSASAWRGRSCRWRRPTATVRIKVARRHGVVMNGQPEFDDCAARASEHGVATKDVHAAAMKAWLEHAPSRQSSIVNRQSSMSFYLTTAIDYVNSRPHLGTAYEKVTADVIARYKRLDRRAHALS